MKKVFVMGRLEFPHSNPGVLNPDAKVVIFGCVQSVNINENLAVTKPTFLSTCLRSYSLLPGGQTLSSDCKESPGRLVWIWILNVKYLK